MKILIKVLMVLMFAAISATANTNNDLDAINLRALHDNYTPSCHFETLGGDRPETGVEKQEGVIFAVIMAPIDGVAALFNLIPTE